MTYRRKTNMNTNRGKMTVVVGGQYGSEGKGAIVRHSAND